MSLSSLNPFSSKPKTIKYLNSKEAQEIDDKLMNESGAFSLDQLMELAGLSIAQCLSFIYPLGPILPLDSNGMKQKRTNERILVCCGPGNQGGDGLVAARHLYHFGYAPSVFYPKESKGEIFARLRKQCENLELPLIAPPPLSTSSFPMAPDAQAVAFKRALSTTDIVLDCVFGFSYKPPVRAPFGIVLEEFKKTLKPILSVDIPSGWSVDGIETNENNNDDKFMPAAVLSLTAPKIGIKKYAEEGRIHWLGGRFVPPELGEEFELNLPSFGQASNQCVDITLRKK